jgi:transcriptional regulator of met regulon
MFTTNKNKVTVLLCLTAFVAFGLTAYTPGATGGPEEYKNLQVLPKDITHEQLDKVMHSFNDALGVKCAYCHVHTGEDWRQGWDFAKDDKDQKQIARHMLRMTMGINATYFNWEKSNMPDTIRVVTCNTCHRGIEHPDAKGIADQMANGGMKQAPPPPPPPANKQ